jgi:CBS domain-containing protein
MDGGRILRSLLAHNRSYASATRVAARIGVGFAFPFAVVGILQFSPLLLLLAWFLYGAATTESRITTVTKLLEGITVGDVARRDIRTVEASDTLADFTNRMIRERTTVYPVTRRGRIVGVVSLADLKRANDRDHDTATVGDVTSEDVSRLAVSSPAFEALELFGRTEGGVVFVEEGSEVVGVVSAAEVGDVLQFQRESEFGVRLPS